jgi:RNA polymerase sigma factor (sigma-70 family)
VALAVEVVMATVEAVIRDNRHIVRDVARKLPPRLWDEAESYGLEALLQAAERWRPDGGSSWISFARRRVRGGMIDGLRRDDWRTRGQIRERVPGHVPIDLIDEPGTAASDPEQIVLAAAARDELLAMVHGLERRRKLVIVLWFWGDLSLGEIASVMGVTESRVCQLKAAALTALKEEATRC